MRIRNSLMALGLVLALQPVAAGDVRADAGVQVAERGSAQARAEVVRAIDDWREAVVRKDRAGLERAYHDDLSYGHTDGEVLGKQAQIDRTVLPERDFTAVDAEGVAVRVYGAQAYVTATYTFHLQEPGQAPRQARLSGLDVWTRGAHGWQLIARQLTRPAH